MRPDYSHLDRKSTRLNSSHLVSLHDALPISTSKAKEGAIPTLKRVAYWPLDEFLDWSDKALATVRDLRRSFTESGDLDWRAKAATALINSGVDAPGLLSSRSEEHTSELQSPCFPTRRSSDLDQQGEGRCYPNLEKSRLLAIG